ncbi:MAG: hypothetical protein K2K79_03360 [Paramuribaculum sp.]|nr:hypothetical protein [Paramuribaculum sp.]
MASSFSILSDIRSHGSRPMQSIKPGLDGAPAFTTLVISNTPVTFGSGNIGRAAVNIVANRLLAMGATPRYLSVGASVDSDTSTSLISTVDAAMSDAAVQAEMEYASAQARLIRDLPGGSGLILTATGVGEMPPDLSLEPGNILPGDVVICTGPVGTFGTAVTAARSNLMAVIESADGNALGDGIHELLRVVPRVRDLIFPERGLNAALDELRARQPGLIVCKDAVPVNPAVQAACEMLDLNAADMPCAGSMLAVVRGEDAERALAALHRSAFCSEAAVIARVE